MRAFARVGALALAAAVFVASPAALAEDQAAPPAPAPASDPGIQAYGAAHPDCLEWTDACVTCAPGAACSTPGIACTPGAVVCKTPLK